MAETDRLKRRADGAGRIVAIVERSEEAEILIHRQVLVEMIGRRQEANLPA